MERPAAKRIKDRSTVLFAECNELFRDPGFLAWFNHILILKISLYNACISVFEYLIFLLAAEGFLNRFLDARSFVGRADEGSLPANAFSTLNG